jgi:hypothetical protein
VAANLAGGTHHAFRDRGEGYCVFNDVAVAAAALRRDGLMARAAVVDCDVHQGNGTAAIFRDDPSVFTFSLHGAKNFPFRKEVSDLDITFEDGAGDDEYLTALQTHLPGVPTASGGSGVLPPGADPPGGGFEAHNERGLRARSRIVQRLPRPRPAGRRRDERRLRADVDAIVTIHSNTIREAVHSCLSVSASDQADVKSVHHDDLIETMTPRFIASPRDASCSRSAHDPDHDDLLCDDARLCAGNQD